MRLLALRLLVLILLASGSASAARRAASSPSALLLASNDGKASSWWQQKMDEVKARTQGQGSAVDPDQLKARNLMKKRSLRDCEQAVELFEKVIERCEATGEDLDPRLCLEAAQARNAVMRIRTHSNTLHITRMLDTPENKKVWRKHGPRAVELASKAKAALEPDPEALVCYADAYFFANSIKGVLAAATTGSGLKFKGNSKELIKRCEKAEGGIGHAYLGAFFLMAPWPLSNAKASEQHLTAAYKIAPCRRNAYYLGVMHYRLGRKGEAARFFREAIAAQPLTPAEGDFTEWVKNEATLALSACDDDA